MIHAISAISHGIMLKLTSFSIKITKIMEIVFYGFHVSRKLWEVKSCSHSIHVNYAHDSLILKCATLLIVGNTGIYKVFGFFFAKAAFNDVVNFKECHKLQQILQSIKGLILWWKEITFKQTLDFILRSKWPSSPF